MRRFSAVPYKLREAVLLLLLFFFNYSWQNMVEEITCILSMFLLLIRRYSRCVCKQSAVHRMNMSQLHITIGVGKYSPINQPLSIRLVNVANSGVDQVLIKYQQLMTRHLNGLIRAGGIAPQFFPIYPPVLGQRMRGLQDSHCSFGLRVIHTPFGGIHTKFSLKVKRH